MRALRTLLAAVMVGAAAIAPASGSRTSMTCGVRWCAGERLPAAVTIVSGDGHAVVIGRDGRVRRIISPWRALPRGAAAVSSGDAWSGLRRGHLVVGRGGRVVWRSHAVVGLQSRLGIVMASGRMVAFQHDHRLWLARVPGAERAVAAREMPLGWTRGGLYTYRYRDRRLLLRSDSGRLVKVIARRPLGSDYAVSGGGLYFATGDALHSARGGRTRRLASLAALGLSTNVWLQPLGRLLELQDDHRLVVLRTDGALFASTSTPRGQSNAISSELAVAPDAASVALTEANRRTGTETVYLLHAGARAPVPLHREHVAFAPCEGGATVQWHGRWLLYADSMGEAAVVDTAGARRAFDLTARVAELPGMGHGFAAYWARQVPRP